MKLWRAGILVCLSMSFASGTASAASLTWSITGGTFADGGTLSGTFERDPARPRPSTWTLNVVGGGSSFPAHSYTPANSRVLMLAYFPNTELTYVFIDLASDKRHLRLTPASALDGSVTSVALSLLNDNARIECFNCAPFRLITGGSLVLISTTPTLTLVSVAPDPTTVGNPTTATVSIDSIVAFGTPTGTITVRDGGLNTVCTITLPAVSCQFNAPATSGGQTLRAQYNGDAHYTSALSNALSYTVVPAVTTTVTLVSVTPNPTTIDTTTTATVSVATIAPNAAPTGTVDVLDGSLQSLCTITLPAVSCTFVPTTPGDQTVRAEYSGDAIYASGFSNVLPLTVVDPDDAGVTGARAIPTLSRWMQLLLAVLFVVSAAWMVKRTNLRA